MAYKKCSLAMCVWESPWSITLLQVPLIPVNLVPESFLLFLCCWFLLYPKEWIEIRSMLQPCSACVIKESLL